MSCCVGWCEREMTAMTMRASPSSDRTLGLCLLRQGWHEDSRGQRMLPLLRKIDRVETLKKTSQHSVLVDAHAIEGFQML